MTSRPTNPYHLLRLPTTAGTREVIQRGRALAGEVVLDREKKAAALRRAVEEITAHPLTRATAQFWEPPGSAYEQPALAALPHAAPPEGALLAERKRRFVEQDCRAAALASLAVPPPLEDLTKAKLDFALWAQRSDSAD